MSDHQNNAGTEVVRRRPGRPSRQEKALRVNTAQHITAHARALFAKKGFAAVSINDVILEANVSKPTLYYYFPDKEALYAATLRDILEKASVYFDESLKQPVPFREKLIHLAEGFLEHSPASLPCLMRDVSQHLNDQTRDAILALYQERIYAPVEVLFAQALRDKLVGDAHMASLLTEMFLTLLDWLNLRLSFNENPQMETHEKAVHMVDFFLYGATSVRPPG